MEQPRLSQKVTLKRLESQSEAGRHIRCFSIEGANGSRLGYLSNGEGAFLPTRHPQHHVKNQDGFVPHLFLGTVSTRNRRGTKPF